MAGRQMRHLLKELDTLTVAEDCVDERSESSQDDSENARDDATTFNPFAFLPESDGEDKAESDSCQNSPKNEIRVTTNDAILDEKESHLDTIDRTSQVGDKSNEKRRNRRKKTKKKKQQMEETLSVSSEDIDEVLKELNLTGIGEPVKGLDSEARYDEESITLRETNLLRIDPRLLQSSSELKQIFGSEVTRRVSQQTEEDRVAGFAGASRRIRRLAARGLIKQQGPLKKGMLITPRNTWPPFVRGDLVLSHVGTSASGREQYSYVPSASYDAMQSKYHQVQASFNPRNLLALLQLHPYHIDSLLTVSDLYRSTGEGQYADEMLEMCIYALEQGWPSTMANIINSGIEIPYSGLNKSLFIALMRYIQVLGKRGLHRTALEVCKLVLSLNAGDPCGVLFTIDYYALRCKKYSFLRGVAELHDQGGAATMPNIVYSLALAKYYEEQNEIASAGSSVAQNVTDSMVLSANDLMAKAIMLHPAILVTLQKKLRDELNLALSQDWVRVLDSEPFILYKDGYYNNPGLQKLVDIFVERNHLLWKAAQIQSFMLQAAERVSSLANASSDMQREDLPLGLTLSDWTSMREQAFPEANGNEYAHLRVQDFSDSVAQLPPEEIHGGPNHGDDLQPADIDHLIQQVHQGNIDDLGDAGALVGFIRSLFPWVNAGQQPNYDLEDESPDENN